jgi:EKC/KEOPS complex subunit CGI121/TPRKB
VFRLSPNNNIGESYKKFGLTDSTTSLIAVKLPLTASSSGEWVVDPGITNESVSRHLGSVVQGTSVEISEEGIELGQGCDVEKVRKVYKLGAESGTKKGKKGAVVNGDGDEKKQERMDMESVILGTIALKGS